MTEPLRYRYDVTFEATAPLARFLNQYIARLAFVPPDAAETEDR